MTTLKLRSVQFIALLSILLLLPLLVQAQSSSELLINYPELIDDGDGLGLGLYFNVTDLNGRVLTNAEVQSARMLLDDGSSYDATVEKPTSPIFITLVLDASGSMGGAAGAMREAAINAVNNAPEEAQFAVIRFNANIDVLTEFTADRNQAIEAINQVQAINLSGTCLYDATFRGIELMRTAPPGRRALILFTDGRDETAQGTVCSSHTLPEVIDLASRPDSRVPIHAVGLSGGNSAINATELRDIADQTGGLAAIGDQAALGGLFSQIMDALKAQWFARAVVFPTAGQHTVQLLATLSDGTFPQPAVAVFIANRDYARIPTITPTAPTSTPTIVTLLVDSVSFDPAAEQITVRTAVTNEQLVSEYRFEFKDENQLLRAEFLLPAPLAETVSFPSRSLQDGDHTLVMTGLDENRRVVARAEPYAFTYQGPTPTPQPPTATPEPVSVTLSTIQYDPPSDVITLSLSVLGESQINTVQINVINADTNLLEKTYPIDPSSTFQLPTTGLVPLGEYVVNVIAQGANGQVLSQSQSNFTYTPILTPTPTPIVVDIAIQGIVPSDTLEDFLVQVQTQNETLIQRYKLRFVDKESGLLVNDFEYNAPPYDTIRVPMTSIPGGQYLITLEAIGAENAVLDSVTIEARITPPTPTPSPTPLTGVQQFIAQARSNPIIIVVIAAIALSLILLLFMLLRQPKKKTGTSFLTEMTGAMPTPMAPPPSSSHAPYSQSRVADPDATNAVPFNSYDPDATNAVANMGLPRATLTVVRTRATNSGQTVTITHSPFTLGRRGRNLSFDEDKDVSREHAEITYNDGSFFITDKGSTQGTNVDGTRLPPGKATRLNPGSRIMLGTSTMLNFEMDAGGSASDYDPEKTNY